MKLFHRIKNSLTQSNKQNQQQQFIVNIAPNLYHMPYPKQNIIHSLQKQIQQLPNPIIYNISEYTYGPQLLGKSIHLQTYTYQLFTSLPLCTMFQILKQIKYKIQTQNANVLVHCQDNNSRSAMLLVIYLYIYSKYQITQAIVTVNKLLNIDTQKQTLFPTQHTFLKNIVNYCIQPEIINKKKLKLLRVIVDIAPELSGLTIQKVLIEIRSYRDPKPIFRQAFPFINEGMGLNFLVDKYNIKINDDFLISIKYVEKNKAYPLLRAQLNTNFIYNKFARVRSEQMDIGPDIKGKPFLLDLIFEENPQVSDLSLLQPFFGRKIQEKAIQQLDIQKHLAELREQIAIEELNFQIANQQYQDISSTHLNEEVKNKLKIIENLIDKDQIANEDDDEDYFRNLENSD